MKKELRVFITAYCNLCRTAQEIRLTEELQLFPAFFQYQCPNVDAPEHKNETAAILQDVVIGEIRFQVIKK